MTTHPCVIRLLAEGGAIEVFGGREPDGTWGFVGRCLNLDCADDGSDTVTVHGVPRQSDLAALLPHRWASLLPSTIHPELRQWFLDRYEDSLAAMPDWRRESHERTTGRQWRALFASMPPDRWSEHDPG